MGPIALPQVESVSHGSENVPMRICSPLLTWQRLLFSVLPLPPLHFLFHPLPVISLFISAFVLSSSPHLPLLSLSLFTSCSSPFLSFLLHLSCSPHLSFSSPLSLLPFCSLLLIPFLSFSSPLCSVSLSPLFPSSPFSCLLSYTSPLSIPTSSPLSQSSSLLSSFLSFLPLPHTLSSAVLFFSPFLFFCSSSPFFSVLSSPSSLFLPL